MIAKRTQTHSLFADQRHALKLHDINAQLSTIAKIVDFKRLANDLDKQFPLPVHDKGGRPFYPTDTMVRILFLKHFYRLSDEQTEIQLLDRASFKAFTELTHCENIPDANTIRNFAQRIGAEGARALFDAFAQQINAQGFIARQGQIVDASLITVPKQKINKTERAQLDAGEMPEGWSEGKAAQKDTEASWTKKHGKSYFGYKMTVNVDKRHKFIREIVLDTASTHDSQHLEAALDPMNTGSVVYADKGYASAAHSEMLQGRGLRDKIQRKGSRGRKLSLCQERRNERIAKSRARVEHVFAEIKRNGGGVMRTIGLKMAKVGMTMKALCYNIQRLAYMVANEIDPFYYPRTVKNGAKG